MEPAFWRVLFCTQTLGLLIDTHEPIQSQVYPLAPIHHSIHIRMQAIH